MRHRWSLSLLGLVAAGLFALGGASPAAGDKDKDGGAHHGGHFLECAKACDACQLECDSCSRHCAEQVADGKKEHMRTLGTCADCGAICSAAARITARGGPMSATICDACARSCDMCAEACDKVGPDDAHMKRCAEECRKCARACREMIKHAEHAPGK
jgi:hypothetical protein